MYIYVKHNDRYAIFIKSNEKAGFKTIDSFVSHFLKIDEFKQNLLRRGNDYFVKEFEKAIRIKDSNNVTDTNLKDVNEIISYLLDKYNYSEVLLKMYETGLPAFDCKEMVTEVLKIKRKEEEKIIAMGKKKEYNLEAIRKDLEEHPLMLEDIDKKEYRCLDNLFDFVVYHTTELGRNAIFFVTRYRNETYAGSLSENTPLEIKRVEMIEKAVKILSELNEETVEFLRETAYIKDDGKRLWVTNNSFLDIENKMSTSFTRFHPVYTEEYEKMIFGENSEEYKRRKLLRELIKNDFNNHPALSGMSSGKETESYWYNMIDILERKLDPKVLESYDKDRITRLQTSLISKFNLTKDDIYYIIGYKFNE